MMKIGEIGNHFKITEKIDYLSDRSFIDFDLLIIDAGHILREHNPHRAATYDKRLSDLNEFLEHKKVPLIIFSPLPRQFDLVKKGILVNSNSISSLFPTRTFETKKEEGENIVVLSQTLFSSFFSKYQQYLSYESYFTNYSGKVLLETPHTKKVLSFYNQECIFLPKIPGFNEEFQKAFLEELYLLAKQVQRNNSDYLLPDWTKKYYLPNEEQTVSKIQDTQTQITDLSNTLSQQQNVLSEYQRRKSIITESGTNLEIEIESILKEIGFEILEAEPGRDDLIIKFQKRIAVVEIKGVSSSAAEKHLAQLEKWVMTYYEKNEAKPKGILIINAFKNDELNKRDSIFPPQMIPFATQREHCLLTTTQLLGIYYDIKINNVSNETLINSLFDTIGVYDNYSDWKQYITYKEEQV